MGPAGLCIKSEAHYKPLVPFIAPVLTSRERLPGFHVGMGGYTLSTVPSLHVE